MRTIAVTPPNALKRIESLAAEAGWDLQPSLYELARPEVALAATREPLLVVPGSGRVPAGLRRILVTHEGSPLVTPAMEMAAEAAQASGAEIVVVHAASAIRPTTPGSLPAPRFVDHGGYDWEEWRSEFLRRFCRCSKGLWVRLEVLTGEPALALSTGVRRLRPDLLLTTWKGKTGPARGHVLAVLLRNSPCPVLVLREPAELARKSATA
jgi:nucleotide-binding universal stress UspA family protein